MLRHRASDEAQACHESGAGDEGEGAMTQNTSAHQEQADEGKKPAGRRVSVMFTDAEADLSRCCGRGDHKLDEPG